MLSRWTLGGLADGTACVGAGSVSSASTITHNLDAIPMAEHEAAMRLAIAAAKANQFYPFGAVIVSTADRIVLAQGVNNGKINPIFHGEIVAINDYIARHGNQGWTDNILYTTGEPCPMCLGAIHWARIGRIYYGFSISDAAAIGFDDREFYRQFTLPPEEREVAIAESSAEEAKLLLAEYLALPGRVAY